MITNIITRALMGNSMIYNPFWLKVDSLLLLCLKSFMINLLIMHQLPGLCTSVHCVLSIVMLFYNLSGFLMVCLISRGLICAFSSYCIVESAEIGNFRML